MRRDRQWLRRLGAAVANPWTVVLSSTVFLVSLVVAFFLPHSIDWLSRLQTVSSVLSLVLLLALQHTQHRDQIALQRKLDELLKVNDKTDDRLVRLESAPEEVLDAVDERDNGS